MVGVACRAAEREIAMASEDWKTVDVRERGEDVVAQWELMKEAYRGYTKLREEFQEMVQADAELIAEYVGLGEIDTQLQELKFGYKFGKLSLAVGDKLVRAKAKVTQRRESFAEYKARMNAEGRAS